MKKKPARPAQGDPAPSRTRMTREQRNRQLMDTAWKMVREEGTDALTLGRLAEEAQVTKPVVYDHFGTREGLLAALYREFDQRQISLMETSLAEGGTTLPKVAGVIAAAYMGCVMQQGREISGVIAALAGSPELEALKRACEADFLEKCSAALTPHAGGAPISPVSLRAMLGAAEALACAAAIGEIELALAEEELVEIISSMVKRGRKKG